MKASSIKDVPVSIEKTARLGHIRSAPARGVPDLPWPVLEAGQASLAIDGLLPTPAGPSLKGLSDTPLVRLQ